MPKRHLPVRPNLDQLRRQAKELLRAIRAGETAALADLAEFHPDKVEPASCKLADAQLVLARSYESPSWPRLVVACRLIDAIWRDDVGEVRRLVTGNPKLVHEDAAVRPGSNWGPPMSYAANLGRDEIIAMLHSLGAHDHQHALGRALLQGQIGTARWLHDAIGAPRISVKELDGPAYTLNVRGTELAFELGASLRGDDGIARAPVAVVIQSDSRRPTDKHAILAIYEQHGFEYPDTPTMALHRGRIDLLEQALARDPSLLTRTFTYEDVFPPSLECIPENFPRTSLDGATLLHLCVEFDELEIARWLLSRGMPVDAPASTDSDGFGGHSALFNAVVCYANFWDNFFGNDNDAPFAKLLLENGANANARASLRERVERDDVVTMREHRDITPLEWGRRFHNRIVVSKPAMRRIAERGGE